MNLQFFMVIVLLGMDTHGVAAQYLWHIVDFHIYG